MMMMTWIVIVVVVVVVVVVLVVVALLIVFLVCVIVLLVLLGILFLLIVVVAVISHLYPLQVISAQLKDSTTTALLLSPDASLFVRLHHYKCMYQNHTISTIDTDSLPCLSQVNSMIGISGNSAEKTGDRQTVRQKKASKLE